MLRINIIVCSLLVLIAITRTNCRKYDRCELGRELYERFKFPKQDLSRWLCIAYWESNFDTSAIYQSYDNAAGHGLFQMSDKYWCQSEKYSVNGCNVTCEAMRDDDIADDISCALTIYRKFGFNGWASNKAKCEADTNDYFGDCDLNTARTGALALTAHPKGITIHLPHPFHSIVKKLVKPSISGYIRIKPFFAISNGIGVDKSLGKTLGLGKATGLHHLF